MMKPRSLLLALLLLLLCSSYLAAPDDPRGLANDFAAAYNAWAQADYPTPTEGINSLEARRKFKEAEQKFERLRKSLRMLGW